MTIDSSTHTIPYQAHQGLWPALLSPLTASGALDTTRLARHAKALLQQGCTGVTLFGTTGEGLSFSQLERQQGLEALIAAGVLPTQIIVHTSALALPEVIALTRHATNMGVHACLLLPPFFFKGVSAAGIFDFYQQVIAACCDLQAPLRLLLYHIPQVTGVGLNPLLVQQLQRCYPQVLLGIKDSGCQRTESLAFMAATQSVAAVTSSGFQVWVGNEPDIPEMVAVGTKGAISGVANLLPQLVIDLLHPGTETPHQLKQMGSFLQLIGGYSMIPAFKGLMTLLYDDPSWLAVRAPLSALDNAQLQQLQRSWLKFHSADAQ